MRIFVLFVLLCLASIVVAQSTPAKDAFDEFFVLGIHNLEDSQSQIVISTLSGLACIKQVQYCEVQKLFVCYCDKGNTLCSSTAITELAQQYPALTVYDKQTTRMQLVEEILTRCKQQ